MKAAEIGLQMEEEKNSGTAKIIIQAGRKFNSRDTINLQTEELKSSSYKPFKKTSRSPSFCSLPTCYTNYLEEKQIFKIFKNCTYSQTFTPTKKRILKKGRVLVFCASITDFRWTHIWALGAWLPKVI